MGTQRAGKNDREHGWGTMREATVDACLESAWKEDSVQTHKASFRKQSMKCETQGRRPSSGTVPSVCAGWKGEGKRGSVFVPTKTPASPPQHVQTHAECPLSWLQTGL